MINVWRVDAADEERNYWPVFSDMALSMLFILMLYVVVQFLDLDKRLIIERLETRQQQVKALILSQVPPGFRSAITFAELDPYRQRLTFSSDVLFPVCEAVLTPRGSDLLVNVGRILSQDAAFFDAIQIEGHTDKTPIGNNCPFASNWELSSARATTVVRLLIDRANVAAPQLSAIGRGEFHPVPGADGDNTADYARNRRIEMTLQYDPKGVMDTGGQASNGVHP